MNRYIKNGLSCAIPGFISIPFAWAMCGVGYFVNMQIDPSSDGLFFYWWAYLFTIFCSFFAVVGFVLGVCEEHGKSKVVGGE